LFDVKGRNMLLLWFVLILAAFVLMSGGCGGSGSRVEDIPTPETPSTPNVVDVTLSGLELSVGILSPDFNPIVTNYTAVVDNTVTSVTVTPTATDPYGVEISVNEVDVESGVGSVIPLNRGVNEIYVIVKALDDPEVATIYTIGVTREIEEGYYEPLPVTQEELDDIWRNGRVDLKLDEMVLPDGRYVKDYLDVPLPWSVSENNSARAAADEPTPITRVQMNAVLARIQKRAWDLTNRDLDEGTRNTNFPLGDEKAQEQEHGYDRSGDIIKFGQKRYVYIYGVYGTLGDLNEKGFNPSMHGNGGCDHDLYGMDCVGFLRECLAAGGLNASPSYAPGDLADVRGWRWANWLAGKSLTIENRDAEIGQNPPQPGDILIYGSYHVGLCVATDTNGDGVPEIAIAHSTGRVGAGYSCEEYQTSQVRTADEIGISLMSNGPIAQNYAWTQSENKSPHRETSRLRLVPQLIAEEIGDITLTWGATPSDLDSHLVGPSADGSRFHIYFGYKEDANAVLDVDDTSSYGPEIITLKTLYPGTYRYYVHNYSRGADTVLSASEAVVVLRPVQGRISNLNQTRRFTVPLSGSGYVWNVFNINVDEQGRATLQVVDTITTNFTDVDVLREMRGVGLKQQSE
jgi:hypothetical protein